MHSLTGPVAPTCFSYALEIESVVYPNKYAVFLWV